MKTFHAYLDKEKIPYTENDIEQNLGWIKREIRKEAFISIFGLTEGAKVELEDDVQLQKAIETLPQARALYDNARKIVAQRGMGSGSTAAIIFRENACCKNFSVMRVWNPRRTLLKSLTFNGTLFLLGA